MKLRKIMAATLVATLVFSLEASPIAAKVTKEKVESQASMFEQVNTDCAKVGKLKTIKKAEKQLKKSKDVKLQKQYKDVHIDEQTQEDTMSDSISVVDSKVSLSDMDEAGDNVATILSVSEETTEEETVQTRTNTTANTALYLDDTYLNMDLGDVADSDENWYYFYSPDSYKISTVMQSPSDGDYDMYLYYLNDTTLNLVGYSTNAGTALESTSYVAGEGYYFLRFAPYTASSNSTISFRIDEISEYDASEPDDNFYNASQYTDSINVLNTIDNAFDKDWGSFTISKDGSYFISLASVASGCQYYFNLYDSNLTSLGGMLSNETGGTAVSLTAGTYYFYVASYDGNYSTSDTYNLRMMKRNSSSSCVIRSKTGKLVEITNNSVYVEGTEVELKFSTSYITPGSNWVSYAQMINARSNSTINLSGVQNGVLKGSSTSGGTYYQDCLKVPVSNCNFWYRVYVGGSSDFNNIISEELGEDVYVNLFIDLTTGQVVDCELNYLYIQFDHTYTFTSY